MDVLRKGLLEATSVHVCPPERGEPAGEGMRVCVILLGVEIDEGDQGEAGLHSPRTCRIGLLHRQVDDPGPGCWRAGADVFEVPIQDE